MNNAELIAAKCIKAASFGFANQMELHSFKDEAIAACLRHYVDGESGTLVKRAAKKEACKLSILQALGKI